MKRTGAQKRILITLPEDMLCDVDSAAAGEGLSRSAYIRQAINHVLRLKHKMEIEDRLKTGYLQMAAINLELAEMGLSQDEKAYAAYEESLSEGE